MNRFFVISLLVICSIASADFVEMKDSEVKELVSSLAQNKRDCWFRTGEVEGEHLSFNKVTGETILTKEYAKCDSDKFLFSTDMLDYSRDIKEALDKKATTMNTKSNKSRCFAWDGERYTLYFKSAGHATIFEDHSDIPIKKNQLLEVGVVPWGHKNYSPEALAEAKLKGWQETDKDVYLVKIKFQFSSGFETEIIFDGLMDFAPLSFTASSKNGPQYNITCSKYTKLGNDFVPKNIIKEVYRHNILYSYDDWTLTYRPASDFTFDVEFSKGDFIEFKPYGRSDMIAYQYNPSINTNSIILEKLNLLYNDKLSSLGCGLASLNYVLSKRGMSYSYDKPVCAEKMVNITEFSKLASDKDLHTFASRTTLEKMKEKPENDYIIYLPDRKHFVALAEIDDDYVWVVDITSHRIISRYKIDHFESIWQDKVAIAISDKPINLPSSDFVALSEDEMNSIYGGDPTCFQCTKIIQYYDVEFCSNPSGNICGGQYRMWYLRYGCEEATSGTCTGQMLPGNTYCSCTEDPTEQYICTTLNNWVTEEMRACQ